MGLLTRLTKSAARAGGSALSRHVVPDSLIPSWKTQKAVSTGYNLLKKASKLTGKKKKPAPASAPKDYKSPALRPVSRPGPKKPKQAFDKTGWSMGRNLPATDGSDNLQKPPGRSSSASSPNRPGLISQRLKDAVKNPRLVAQMGVDLLKADYQRKKSIFLSNLTYAVRTKSLKNW